MAEYLTLKYGIIKACPNIDKHEYLNVGLLFFHKDMANLYITQSPERIYYAFNNDINDHSIQSLQDAISNNMKNHGDPDSCVAMLKERRISGFTISDISESTIERKSTAYKDLIKFLMKKFVDNSYVHEQKEIENGHLNIYSPFSVNMEGFVIGTREGLVQLREAIDKALISNHGLASTVLVASEGESYQAYVMRTDALKITGLQEMYSNDMVFGEAEAEKIMPEAFLDIRIEEIKEEKKENKKSNIAGHKSKPTI